MTSRNLRSQKPPSGVSTITEDDETISEGDVAKFHQKQRDKEDERRGVWYNVLCFCMVRTTITIDPNKPDCGQSCRDTIRLRALERYYWDQRYKVSPYLQHTRLASTSKVPSLTN